jgi:pseudouridine-5'-phosphate glycosidase
MGLEGSVLVANPVPAEQEIPYQIMEGHILEALQEAERENIRGKALTPFLLKFLAEHTKGESLEANMALIRHNARLGAQIAKAYGE